MDPDDIRYLDHERLAARGWTRGLVERFLKRPDSWATVAHWLNYKGKALYDTERVIATEASAEFVVAYDRSLRRRGITEETAAAFNAARALHDAEHRRWLATLTPQDIARMVAVQEAAATFESLRERGYRTPHK